MHNSTYSNWLAATSLEKTLCQHGFVRCVHLVYKSSTLQSSMYVRSMFKAPPPPNWRSRSRVVASYHVLIGSGTGAVHTHGPHIRMSIFHTHLCATSPSCSVTDPSVTQSYLTNDTFFAASHMICITLHILPCWQPLA